MIKGQFSPRHDFAFLPVTEPLLARPSEREGSSPAGAARTPAVTGAMSSETLFLAGCWGEEGERAGIDRGVASGVGGGWKVG
jgi:hypothetical protein